MFIREILEYGFKVQERIKNIRDNHSEIILINLHRRHGHKAFFVITSHKRGELY